MRYPLPTKYKSKTILSKKVDKLAKAVSRLKPEIKTLQTTVVNSGIGVAGGLYPLDIIAQGTTSVTRIGNEIRPVKIDFNYQLESEVADDVNTFRVIIVQTKARMPLIVQDFPAMHSAITPEMSDKYTVLYDRRHQLQCRIAGNAAGVPVLVSNYGVWRGIVKPKRKVGYTDASSVSLDNGLYAFFLSDSAAVAHPDVENFNATLFYTDN